MAISLDHLRDLARQAYYGTSSSPERMGESTINQFTAELNDDLLLIQKAAPPDLPADQLDAIIVRYIHKYTSLLRAWLSSHSNVVSWFIAGPSNFPAARMQKRSNWADNHYNNFRSWRSKALKAIIKGLKPKTCELDRVRLNLQQRMRYQRIMVAANKLIRKNDDHLNEQLEELGFAKTQIIQLLTPDWSKRTGFKPYQLSNNNAQIRRLSGRLKELEEKQLKADTLRNITEEINGRQLVLNYELDRIQIIFPAKPPADICKALRREGFVWSPSNKAWQRKLTPQAIHIAREFLQQH
ncbi:hypothetical protein ACQ86N_22560 [Puia sp. P3]|uniref:hypothetical protein n=1 Tax=Puia sp. P3 TaxID=3423952 RepID=UPI003D67A9B2